MAEASRGTAQPHNVQGNETNTPDDQGAHPFSFQTTTQVQNPARGITAPPVIKLFRASVSDTVPVAAISSLPEIDPRPYSKNATSIGRTKAGAGNETGTRTRAEVPSPSHHARLQQKGHAATHPLQIHPSPVPGGKHPWHMRRTAYINYDISSDTASMPKGRVYVERLRPQYLLYPTPIVLIQGDHHSSDVWLTKPDGRQGWASAFLLLGYEVVLLDLPPHGRSTGYGMFEYVCQDVNHIETEFTASATCAPLCWPSALCHDKWPGTGRRGDPVFTNYCTALNTAIVSRSVQQTLSQAAIVSVLRWLSVEAAILVGEGSGSTAAWLAADRVPELVATIIAVEPDGPPFVNSNSSQLGGRQCGIADIPLLFDPPLSSSTIYLGLGGNSFDGNALSPFELVKSAGVTGRGESYLQAEGNRDAKSDDPFEETGPSPVRRLVNLARFPHAIVTAEASRHSTFDWATVDFLRQAGVNVQWLELAKYGIRGNGHLCFLEINSNVIAKFLSLWIQRHIPCARVPNEGQGNKAASFHASLPVSRPGCLDPSITRTSRDESTAKEPVAASNTVDDLFATVHAEEPLQTPSLRELNWKYRESISRSITAGQHEQAAASERSIHLLDTFATQPTAQQRPVSFTSAQPDLLPKNLSDGHKTKASTIDKSCFQLPNGCFAGPVLAQTYQAQTSQVQSGQTQFSQAFGDTSASATGGVPGPLGISSSPASNLASLYPFWKPAMFHGYDLVPGHAQGRGNDQGFLFCDPELALPVQTSSGQYIAQHALPGMGMPLSGISGFDMGSTIGVAQPILSGQMDLRPTLTLTRTGFVDSAPMQIQIPADVPSQQPPSADAGFTRERQGSLSNDNSHGTRTTGDSPKTGSSSVSGRQRQATQSPTGQYLKCQGKWPGATSDGRGRGGTEDTASCAKRKRDDSTAPLSAEPLQ